MVAWEQSLAAVSALTSFLRKIPGSDLAQVGTALRATLQDLNNANDTQRPVNPSMLFDTLRCALMHCKQNMPAGRESPACI